MISSTKTEDNESREDSKGADENIIGVFFCFIRKDFQRGALEWNY